MWNAPGVTIGNPFGRIALAATTGYEEMRRDSDWEKGTLKEEKFRRIAAMGYSRSQVLSPNKYVDDNSCESLLLCKLCVIEFIMGTYSAAFEVAENGKFIDLLKGFTRTK